MHLDKSSSTGQGRVTWIAMAKQQPISYRWLEASQEKNVKVCNDMDVHREFFPSMEEIMKVWGKSNMEMTEGGITG